MKKLSLLITLLLSLNLFAQDSIATDSTEKKFYVSFFGGNTGLTDFIWETYYPFVTNYSEGKATSWKFSAGVDVSLKMKKNYFFNMSWSLNIINSEHVEDLSKNSNFISGTPYSVNNYSVKHSAYVLKPGFSKNLFETEKFTVNAGFNIPFIFYQQYTMNIIRNGYDASKTLVSSYEDIYTVESAQSVGLEFSSGINYLACNSFYLCGKVGIGLNYTWSDSNLISTSKDLMTGIGTSPLIIYKSFQHFGTSDVFANLGFGFRF